MLSYPVSFYVISYLILSCIILLFYHTLSYAILTYLILLFYLIISYPIVSNVAIYYCIAGCSGGGKLDITMVLDLSGSTAQEQLLTRDFADEFVMGLDMAQDKVCKTTRETKDSSFWYDLSLCSYRDSCKSRRPLNGDDINMCSVGAYITNYSNKRNS